MICSLFQVIKDSYQAVQFMVASGENAVVQVGKEVEWIRNVVIMVKRFFLHAIIMIIIGVIIIIIVTREAGWHAGWLVISDG